MANIFQEIHQDLGKPVPASGNLDRWVEQGVFSLNSVLTVRAYETGSHRNVGWETFTDAVIRKLSEEREHLVFMLWGNYAKAKKNLIDGKKHLILEAAHPSPRFAEHGFLVCKHFSKANTYSKSNVIQAKDWYECISFHDDPLRIKTPLNKITKTLTKYFIFFFIYIHSKKKEWWNFKHATNYPKHCLVAINLRKYCPLKTI